MQVLTDSQLAETLMNEISTHNLIFIVGHNVYDFRLAVGGCHGLSRRQVRWDNIKLNAP